MKPSWPEDWEQLRRGVGCAMCASVRPDVDAYGIRIKATDLTDAVLQRARVQPGYTLVIWRGRHVNEPTELPEEEASLYWRDVLTTARALIEHYKPIKMNYETLGNSLPHLHTHLIPRYNEDPAPGRPFPLLPLDGSEPQGTPRTACLSRPLPVPSNRQDLMSSERSGPGHGCLVKTRDG